MEIQKYSELKEYLKAFSNPDINLLIIKSRGGLGKTTLIKDMYKEAIFITGNITPLSLYITLYENYNKMIVFDDLDGLFKNKQNISILKQLCEDNKEKLIKYNSTSNTTRYEIENEFISKSRIIILCNNLNLNGSDLEAFKTRSLFIEFKPSNEEVFNELIKFANDKEILNDLNANISKIKHFNFRVYNTCLNLKNSNLDYLDYLNREFKITMNIDEFKIIENIILLPISERNKIWRQTTNKSLRCLQRRIKEFKQYKAKRQTTGKNTKCVKK